MFQFKYYFYLITKYFFKLKIYFRFVAAKASFILNYVNKNFLYKYFLKIKLKVYGLEKYYIKKFTKVDNDIVDNENQIIKQNKSLIFKETVNMLARRQKNKFYLPFSSFWPLFLTASVALFLIFITIFFHSSKLYSYLNGLTLISIFAVGVSVSFWFSIFFFEKKKGNHTVEVRRNIELGFYLFLFTEALCFLALFWVFLHSFLAAGIHAGIYNPGEGIANLYINEPVKISKNWNIYGFSPIGTPSYYRVSSLYTMADRELYDDVKNLWVHINFYDKGQLIDPYKLPLLNTFILLTSAACLNVSHLSVRISKYLKSFLWLFFTIILGLFFVSVQYKEYKDCSFQYNDGIYAACFFSLTGLHGIHVMIGISALIICAINLLFQNYSPNSHQSYIYSIFYWHFVDIIWIFVYFIIYLWPASYFFVDELYTTYGKFFTINFSKDVFFTVLKEMDDYYVNTGIIDFYFNVFKHFNKCYSNFDILTKKSFFESKNYVSDFKINKNIFEIDSFKIKNSVTNIDKAFLKDRNMTLNPAMILVHLLKYSGVKGFHYLFIEHSGEEVWSIYKFKKPIINMYDNSLFKFIADYVEVTSFTLNNFNIYSRDEMLEFLFKCHYVLDYKTSLYFGIKLAEINYAHELYLNKDFINFNEIKRDPNGICFVLTVMHNELMYSVENVKAIDANKKYKRFFVLVVLQYLNFKYLEHIWSFFFFPYLLSKDAAVRFSI